MKSLDLGRLKVLPLDKRKSLTQVEHLLVAPASVPEPLPANLADAISEAAERIRAARVSGAQVILMYGAHLLRNGAALIVTELMERGWITQLATNGAGTIHDWEYAWLGR